MIKFVETPPSSKLLCVACKASFASPWDLMVHAQTAHQINIYELGAAEQNGKDLTDTDSSSVGPSESADTNEEVSSQHSSMSKEVGEHLFTHTLNLFRTHLIMTEIFTSICILL